MQMVITPAGNVRCLYDETIPLGRFGSLAIARGSHVEPTADGGWLADLGPVEGPTLGPFSCRSEALDAERRWLETHWLVSE
jgi:hypothetical protein